MTTTTTTVATPQVGQKAPDFTLANSQDGTPWTLSEAVKQGPVVLTFMPGAFTTPCTKEVCTFRDTMATYETAGAQVVGVTVDSKHAQLAWAAKEGIKYPLLSDFEKKASSQWGNLFASSWGMTNRRSTYVIDRTGTIRFAHVQQNAAEDPPYADVQAALQSLD